MSRVWTKKQKKKGQKTGGSLKGDPKMSLKAFGPPFMPETTDVKLTYVEWLDLTASVKEASYVYKPNSCYDPNQTGAGGQPGAFDLWKQLYYNYRVVAFEYEITFIGENGFVLGVAVPVLGSSPYADAHDAAGLKWAKSGVASTQQMCTLRGRHRVSDILGVPDATVLAEDNYQAVVSADPSTKVYLQFLAHTTGNSDIVGAEVKLIQYVRFERPTLTLDAVARRRRDERLMSTSSTAGSDARLLQLPSSAVAPEVMPKRAGALLAPTQETTCACVNCGGRAAATAGPF